MKVAVFGSRTGFDLQVVGTYLNERFDKEVILVSGGAEGVDRYAETVWQGLGGRVISLRPVMVGPDEWGVEWWEFGGDSFGATYVMIDHPTFETKGQACIYRDALIAHVADRGVAFRFRKSRGTGNTIDFFRAEQKPVAIHEQE